MRNFLDDSIAEHNSLPPLRWIANWAGNLSAGAMLRLVYAEEDGVEKGFRYKLDGYIYDYLWPFYYKYGTMYRLRMDLSGKNWDDYDENGIPYWNYYDEETGEALRIIDRKE